MLSENGLKTLGEQYFSENDYPEDHTKDSNSISSDKSYATDFLKTRDVSLEDKEEQEKITQFFKKSCCNRKCNFVIPRDMILKSRNNFIDLEKDQQDLIILSKIESGKTCDALDDAYAKISGRKKYENRKETLRTKSNIVYTYYKLPICRQLFLFIYACGLKRYKALLRHFDVNGIIVRKHGKINKPSSNSKAIQPSEITKIVEFINSIAERLAFPLPGRLRKFKDYGVMKLPSSENMSSIYRMYISSLSPDERRISNRSFRRVWNKYIPYVTVMKPADDICDFCRGNSLKILQLRNCREEVREEKVSVFLNHLQKARNQRTYYQTFCRNNVNTVKVVSFDFAQTVHYPTSPQQPRNAFFKKTRKCAVFGIANEKEKLQFNYLIDEKDSIGKGPNCVVSILHHYLKTSSNTETLVLFSDNCVGQNKNNVVIGYLMWRVAKGLQKAILFNFLLTGHTKFTPDRFFGIFKAKYAVSNIDTHDDLMKCVVASSPSGHNKAVSAENVTWYDWANYLQQFYKPLIGITQYHHFIISSNSVKVRQFADSEETIEFKLLQQPVNDLMPNIIKPVGLSLERQWYMYNNLRELVSDIAKVDDVAPLPKQMLAKKDEKENDTSELLSRNKQETMASMQDDKLLNRKRTNISKDCVHPDLLCSQSKKKKTDGHINH
ncbi:uncharacterized protein [Onthophagus taurus]|uniref:uncharacterized protein n=1 Tax=Onthophagus taurus TaxID=166361 RepID=UPI0039BE1A3E